MNKPKQLVLMCVAMALMFAGCTPMTRWTRLDQKVYQEKARKFSAELPKDWMRFNWDKDFIMTKDGLALNRIVVSRRKFNQKLEFTKRVYVQDMMPQELAEVEIDNLSSSENAELKIVSNQPTKIDERDAFKVEYQYKTMGGLKVNGRVYGFAENEKVYRIFFEAAQQHYYKKAVKDFERFIETFKVL